MVRDIAVRVAEIDPIGVERRSQRAARIARRRWYEHAFEPRLGENPRVGHAVQGDAAAETQVGQAGFLVEGTRDVHECVFENPLHAGGAVREASALVCFEVDGIVALASRAEQIHELRRIGSAGRRLVFEVLGDEGESPSGVRRSVCGPDRSSSARGGEPITYCPFTAKPDTR